MLRLQLESSDSNDDVVLALHGPSRAGLAEMVGRHRQRDFFSLLLSSHCNTSQPLKRELSYFVRVCYRKLRMAALTAAP